MYVKVENGVARAYSLTQLRRDNPNVSFPQDAPDLLLAEYGVYRYTSAKAPAFNPLLEWIEPGDFELNGGKWVKTWVVVRKPTIQVMSDVRAKRSMLLAESDWTQVADAPTDKAAWATYRQALRDIPQQADFPNNVVWPVAPE